MQMPEHVGKMLISTTIRVQIAVLEYDFLIYGGPIYLPVKYQNKKESL
jgi:hypothetical protein